MPWVLIAAILGFGVVPVTQVAYEVEGWGVGELVVADDRVVWHELPWPRLVSGLEDGTDGCEGSIPNPHPPGARARRITESVRQRSSVRHGSRATAAGVLRRRAGAARGRAGRSRLRDAVPHELCKRAADDSARGGRHLRRARGARRRDPARPAPPGASARAATSRSSSRATASSPPAASAPTAPTAPAINAVSSRSRAMPTLSDDLREELAAISPTSDCDRLAELSGLFHVAGRAHLRGRGSVDVHLDVSSSTVARRAFALLRALRCPVRDPHLPASRVRQGDPLPTPRGGLGGRLRDAEPGRRARPLSPAARPRPAASSYVAAAPPRTSAARCSARGR